MNDSTLYALLDAIHPLCVPIGVLLAFLLVAACEPPWYRDYTITKDGKPLFDVRRFHGLTYSQGPNYADAKRPRKKPRHQTIELDEWRKMLEG